MIAAAKTGSANLNKKAVTKIDQTNSGIAYLLTPRERLFPTVTIKLIAPKMEEAPDRWRLKIAKSTAGPE